MAKLSDRYGRRKIYILALSIFAFGSLIVALSENLNLLLVGRAIQGFGASGIFPVDSAVVGDIFPTEKRGRAPGLTGVVFEIAFILGPLITGLFLKFIVWNDLFLFIAIFAIFLAISSIFLKSNRGKLETISKSIK